MFACLSGLRRQRSEPLRELGKHCCALLSFSLTPPSSLRRLCDSSSDSSTTRLAESLKWLSHYKNYETDGVPKDAGIQASSSAMDLTRMGTLLRHLGSPHQAIPNVIHVVGTKGKGSVTSLLVNILSAAGLRAGCYTSPHMVHLNERISGPGCSQHISDDAFADLIDSSKAPILAAQAECGERITHFELITALAIRHFANLQLDWVVMEAGLGGVMDATNVFDSRTVKACVLTAMERDHMDALGGSIESIALAKVGIFKPGGLAVLARQPFPEAQAVALEHAARIGCSVHTCDSMVQSQGPMALDGLAAGDGPVQELTLQGDSAGSVISIFSRLVGRHQSDNIAAAAQVAALLRTHGIADVPLRVVAAGVEATRLGGRFETLRCAFGSNPEHWLVLDCAHTALSVQALCANLRDAFAHSRCAVILAIAADKDLAAVAAQLAILRPALVVCTRVPIGGQNHRSTEPAAVGAAIEAAMGLEEPRWTAVVTADDMSDAVRQACAWADVESSQSTVICVTGSNYAVGAIYGLLQSAERNVSV